jgi:hypothetical protein
MKRFLALLIIFSLFALPCHAGVTGSVSLANIRLSLVNGAAFVDFSAAGALNYLNGKLTLTDSAGKKAIGYIKAAGTGETYSDLITNKTFEGDASGWVATRGTIEQSNDTANGGTYSGKLSIDAGQTSAYAVATATSYAGDGALFYGAIYGNKGTLSGWRLLIVNQLDQSFVSYADVATAGWGLSANYITAANATGIKVGIRVSGTQSQYGYVDDVFLGQVLTPSSTGVTITSTPGGSTYNWASIESGFNYNDASGYTYTIVPRFVGGGLGMGIIYGF